MTNSKKKFIERLRFKPATFLIGFAGVLDIGGTLSLHRFPRSFEEDAKAVAGDWATVGRDIQTATEKFEQEATKNR